MAYPPLILTAPERIMKNKFREFFKHRQRKQYLRVSMPVSHYFKSKKHKRCQEPSMGSCRCWLCKSCKVFLSRHPAPHPSRVKFNWFHIRVSCSGMLSYSYLSGLSVAFGSTGCSGSAGGRAPFAPLARGTNSLGGPGACPPPPRDICKIGLSKMQFPISCVLDRDWVTGIMTGIISFFFRLYALHN